MHHFFSRNAAFTIAKWAGICLIFSSFANAADQQNSRPNVLLICVDDLRPELNCYGASYIQSPNIDELASSGTLFSRHYVQAPTCGASRSALLTGKYGGSSNFTLLKRAERISAGQDVLPSMPEWFKQNGYTTVSVGKVSHHPGGRGGPDWNDPSKPEMPNAWDKHLLPFGQWKHPRGWMHGLAHGEIRTKGSNNTDVFQSAEGDDSIYPDGPSIDESLRQLDALNNDKSKPFFLAVGILRPHLPFGAPAKYMGAYRDITLPPIPHPQKPSGKTTWHRSGEFMNYNLWGKNPNEDAKFADQVRRHYAACVSYADAQVGKLVQSLKASGAWENTIVVLWGDHGYHLGEHAIWGKHALFEESLHSPLIIRTPDMQRQQKKTDGIVESIDLFPTLCELANLPAPGFVEGVSLVPMLTSPGVSGHPAISYFKKAQTIRTDTHRLIIHRGGHQELYDHRVDDGETNNVAKDYPEIVSELQQQLNERLPSLAGSPK
ncbi:Choline-sulfatase [Rubripirellula obstinata]|uniref:Choline-sulfatase n=1 Tax=Rubripirellula obstinata TaxID=406547 RepID=A0A5B1CKT4_9BACT|nr:sulfatase [Rubripirellula obstinata]KAA1260921.1 Choline-sulfatase [Rubripirellula obstinata]